MILAAQLNTVYCLQISQKVIRFTSFWLLVEWLSEKIVLNFLPFSSKQTESKKIYFSTKQMSTENTNFGSMATKTFGAFLQKPHQL
jgi:hypothetical protein